MCCCCLSDCCLVLLALVFPPLPVWIKRGFCSTDSLINILLTVLGYVPGLIHSFYIISKYPMQGLIIIDEECGEVIARDGSGSVRVVRVNHNHHGHPRNHQQPQPQPQMQPQMQPQPPSQQQPLYPSVAAGSSNNRNYGAIEPPAYTELDKTHK